MIVEQIEKFMRESNWIEGERETDYRGTRGMLRQNDIKSAKKFLGRPMTEKSLKKLHFELSEGRDILRGEWRDCQVYIGKHTPVAPEMLIKTMGSFFHLLSELDAWEAHNKFEWIHPWEDLNGRTGRLIYLHKLGGEINMPFLQHYYYETLKHYN